MSAESTHANVSTCKTVSRLALIYTKHRESGAAQLCSPEAHPKVVGRRELNPAERLRRAQPARCCFYLLSVHYYLQAGWHDERGGPTGRVRFPPLAVRPSLMAARPVAEVQHTASSQANSRMPVQRASCVSCGSQMHAVLAPTNRPCRGIEPRHAAPSQGRCSP